MVLADGTDGAFLVYCSSQCSGDVTLVVCHGGTPHHVSFEWRAAAEAHPPLHTNDGERAKATAATTGERGDEHAVFLVLVEPTGATPATPVHFSTLQDAIDYFFHHNSNSF